MKLGFLITAYNQKREVKFTVDMLRNKWQRTKDSLISIVISGDPERSVKFPNDQKTRVTSLDDMVGQRFNELVSTSIAKQIMHGMLELKDLQREYGEIDYIVHMHGDILLINENGFFEELERFIASGKFIACDTVGPQKTDYIEMGGNEIMPQLFVVRRDFCDSTGFMHIMNVSSIDDKKSTEHMLLSNLATTMETKLPFIQKDTWPYNITAKALLYEVVKHRSSQWNFHNHWGGFCHFGNSIHFTQQQREEKNEYVLRALGLNLEAWNASRD